MNLTKHEQLDLIRRIENEVIGIADYVYPDGDNNMNRAFDRLEEMLAVLRQSFYDENTYIKLRDRDTGEIEYRYFEQGDVDSLCYRASRYYAWSDCDDTYEVVEIMCDGRKLEYVGWQPCMLFEFCEVDTGKTVYSAEFPEWEH